MAKGTLPVNTIDEADVIVAVMTDVTVVDATVVATVDVTDFTVPDTAVDRIQTKETTINDIYSSCIHM